MNAEQTETKQDVGRDVGTEAVAQLRAMADEIRTNSAASRGVMLCSIETLLAGADILSCDCVAALREERDVLDGGMQSQQLEAEEPWRQIPFKDCEPILLRIEKILESWQPDMRRAVLYYAMQRLPEQETAWASERASDEARDELLNYLYNNKSFDEQADVYRMALAAIKEGNGIVGFKKAG